MTGGRLYVIFLQVLLVESVSKALETVEKQEEQKRYEKMREATGLAKKVVASF